MARLWLTSSVGRPLGPLGVAQQVGGNGPASGRWNSGRPARNTSVRIVSRSIATDSPRRISLGWRYDRRWLIARMWTRRLVAAVATVTLLATFESGPSNTLNSAV